MVDLIEVAKSTPDDVYTLLESVPHGLTSAEASSRLTRYGRNVLQEAKTTPLLVKFLANFVHLMALLLWAGGALAFVAQMPQLGVAVWMVILINAVFSFWQEYKAERATEALKKLLPSFARVMRDGSEVKILAEEIVPGDVLVLAEGDNIPADGRFVEEFEVRTNNATLTGESTPVRKTAQPVDAGTITEMRNLAFAGTSIASGTGKVVVINTGMNTRFGMIAHLTQSVEDEQSPLQKEMERVTRLITFLSVGLGVLFFLLGTLIVRMELIAAFLFAIGVIVANVPEGLLPTVTLSLALGVQRMAKRHALIKKLSSVETLGCTTVICTDKTGTLTQNAMTVRDVWTAGGRWRVTGEGYEPDGELIAADGKAVTADVRELLRDAMLCSNARLIDGSSEGKSWYVLGDPTEGALVVAAAKIGLKPDALPRLFELPFESRRKRMTTLHRDGQNIVALVKGAPNEILKVCSHLVIDGQKQALTPQHLRDITRANDAYAAGALRVLAVARREFETRPAQIEVETIECDLTFIGLIAMMDPPRPEVSDAVERCATAGIRIVMITGDYGLTAESIARRIGLVRGNNVRTITGADLETMDETTLKAALDDEVIFARVAPEHKLRVVTAFQDKGHIVAVTGDGVNDAPALKKADIGVAMGITGTDVAKEAADMILTDDNFASVVNAVEEGRAVYDNIKKFVTYIFASNIPELIPFIAMVLFKVPLALTVMQILAIDLGTDMLPALALGTETPEKGVMSRPPRPANERLLNRRLLLRAYGWLGLMEAFFAYVGFFVFIQSMNVDVMAMIVNGVRVDLLPYAERLTTHTGQVYVLATTIFHMGVVAAQIGNAYACRANTPVLLTKDGGFRWLVSNRFLMVGIVFELVLMNLLIYTPLNQAFELGAISPLWWGFVLWYAPLLFVLDEALKWLRSSPHPVVPLPQERDKQ